MTKREIDYLKTVQESARILALFEGCDLRSSPNFASLKSELTEGAYVKEHYKFIIELGERYWKIRNRLTLDRQKLESHRVVLAGLKSLRRDFFGDETDVVEAIEKSLHTTEKTRDVS